MRYKQIYDKSNGKPDLIMYDETQPINYDISKYTEIQPPNDIYEPMHFEHNRWVGTPYEEWKRNKK